MSVWPRPGEGYVGVGMEEEGEGGECRVKGRREREEIRLGVCDSGSVRGKKDEKGRK